MKKNEAKELLQQGTYYNMAFQWYCNKYKSLYKQRIIFLLLGLMLFTSAFVSANILTDNLKVKKLPFPVYFDDTINQFLYMRPLSASKRIDIAISDYLINEYILLRETYSPTILQEKNWKKIQQKIMGFSSRKIYADYLDYISYQNPDSPLLQFLQNKKRAVKINKIEYDENHNNANVLLTITTSKGAELTIEDYIVNISYLMPSFEQIINRSVPFKFIIVGYKIEKI